MALVSDFESVPSEHKLEITTRDVKEWSEISRYDMNYADLSKVI